MSLHVEKRMIDRQITRKEIVEVILQGEIIEEYPNDWPHPSCLIFGCTINGRYLHVVVAIEPLLLRLVTVYEPDPEIFPDMKHRRKE
ncbi:DUF4258 domain-containing protein [Anaerovibrio sp.]|nr:DUF4258 domain-containing protein [Anaerovibrio sp.]MBR2142687.1 DUF4258 domain-containing protein [Anaerovibrio sp.]